MIRAILILSLMGQPYPYVDGDPGFSKVDTLTPPNELPVGVVSDAQNKRFEDGRAWPRYGVDLQSWGQIEFVGTAYYVAGAFPLFYAVTQYPLVIGRKYFYIKGNENFASDAISVSHNPLGNTVNPGFFIAQTTAVYFWQLFIHPPTRCTAQILGTGRPRAFGRFNDPQGFDNLIVVTDEARTGSGEDGGVGRAYRMISGNRPQELSLNGHDVYGEARLVQTHRGIVLLRQDVERHYFVATAVNAGTSQIQLNCTPSWNDGDLVLFFAFPNSYILGTSPPNPLTTYAVKNIAGNKVELYTDGTFGTKLDMSGGAAGSFYLERRAVNPGYFGNGAPPLIMQEDGTGKTPFEIGFLAVPPFVVATAFDATSKVLSCPNNRLIPGDQITYFHNSGATETFYVNPIGPHAVMLYTTEANALAGGLANAQTPSPAYTSGDHIAKVSASGQAMPPGREGAYLPINRLILVNNRDTLPISDPLDPLHFTPMQATVTANLGESDLVTAIVPMTNDRAVIGKQNKLLQFNNLSLGPNSWSITEITNNYGWIAPLACKLVGKDAWGLSRQGVTSVFATEQGELQGLALPVSRPMKAYLDMVDWTAAAGACAETWNNRYFLAVPLKGQAAGQQVNNAILVYNILNQGWEGLWTGAALQVYCFSRCLVFGQERLCFVNYQAQVAYFDEGFYDPGNVQISDTMTTRLYTAGNTKPKLWLVADTVWDTYGPTLSVSADAPGYNEVQKLVSGLQYDKTQYLAAGQAAYNPSDPNANFDAPYRQDYTPSLPEMLKAKLNVHQNVPERWRMRVNDWGVQITIANSSGSARIQSVVCSAMPTRELASRRA